MAKAVWFWQRIVTPHMASLAAALAQRGVSTTFVAEQALSADRIALGWEPSPLGRARVVFVSDEAAVRSMVATAPSDSVHICQGLRANGLIGTARKLLIDQGRTQWVIMEETDDDDWKGPVRRALYGFLIRSQRKRIKGFLAIGGRSPDWLTARGAPPEQIFPFTYFLANDPASEPCQREQVRPFRFLFVGQFIERKRLDLLIQALSGLRDREFELVVVGSGPLESMLKSFAQRMLGNRLVWRGRLHRSAIGGVMASGDCLVLPSSFDGWGAVASEAMISGTPVVCSDACGCEEVVRLSGSGGVFARNDAVDLAMHLVDRLDRGQWSASQRKALAQWARALQADAGAAYLEHILAYSTGLHHHRPVAPWITYSSDRSAP